MTKTRVLWYLFGYRYHMQLYNTQNDVNAGMYIQSSKDNIVTSLSYFGEISKSASLLAIHSNQITSAILDYIYTTKIIKQLHHEINTNTFADSDITPHIIIPLYRDDTTSRHILYVGVVLLFKFQCNIYNALYTKYELAAHRYSIYIILLNITALANINYGKYMHMPPDESFVWQLGDIYMCVADILTCINNKLPYILIMHSNPLDKMTIYEKYKMDNLALLLDKHI